MNLDTDRDGQLHITYRLRCLHFDECGNDEGGDVLDSRTATAFYLRDRGWHKVEAGWVCQQCIDEKYEPTPKEL